MTHLSGANEEAMKADKAEGVPLPYLETFTKAAERCCFTTAAAGLGLTQAAVSQRVQALEKALGVSLFARQGGRVLLTEAGHRLYDYAQRILALHQEARQEVTGHKMPLTGELFLAASSVPGEHLLPGLLARFRERHPHIQVRATVADSQVVLERIEQGQAHLGLVGGKTDNPHLEFRCFAWDQLALIVPGEHTWGRRKRVRLSQLAEQPLIVREVGSGSRWCLERALAKADKSLGDLAVTLELGSNEAIKEAVLRGLGLTVLSTYSVQKELQSGKLHALEVLGLDLTRNIFVIWDRRRALPIPARLFLDLLESDEASQSPS
jgi:DNA-binding transcriptional LysR family regulator